MSAASLLVVVGCATEAPSPIAHTPADVSVAPPRSPAIQPCGGATRPPGEVSPPLPRRAVRPGATGYDALVAPPGFVSVPVEVAARYTEEEDGGSLPQDSPLYYMSAPRDPDRIGLWTYYDEELTMAVLDTFRHVATEPRERFEREVMGRFDPFDTPLEPDEDVEGRWRWFGYALRWRSGERLALEWAYVEKGCEREEVYERFVRDGDVLWHVRLRVQATIEATTLADWVTMIFDAPLGVVAPDGRIALFGTRSKG